MCFFSEPMIAEQRILFKKQRFIPESVSIHQCASFVVCDMPIKVNFIGMLQAMKVAC
jgi:hypothetical protein